MSVTASVLSMLVGQQSTSEVGCEGTCLAARMARHPVKLGHFEHPFVTSNMHTVGGLCVGAVLDKDCTCKQAFHGV